MEPFSHTVIHIRINSHGILHNVTYGIAFAFRRLAVRRNTIKTQPYYSTSQKTGGAASRKSIACQESLLHKLSTKIFETTLHSFFADCCFATP